LHEDDLIVIADMHDFAHVGNGLGMHGIIGFTAMAHLHERVSLTMKIDEMFLGFL
jgi:hypothetical protein